MTTDPRTLRKEREKQQRMQDTIAVAKPIFVEQGFVDTSMDDIAKQVGISKPLIYNYFGSKEGLFIGVAADSLEVLNTQFATFMTQNLPIANRLGQFFFDFIHDYPLDAHIVDDMRLRDILADLQRRQALGEELMEHEIRFLKAQAESYESLAKVVEQIKDEGKIPHKLDTLVVSNLMSFLITGVSRETIIREKNDQQTPEQSKAVLDLLFQYFLDGLSNQ